MIWEAVTQFQTCFRKTPVLKVAVGPPEWWYNPRFGRTQLTTTFIQCLNCGKRSGRTLTSERDAELRRCGGEVWGRGFPLPAPQAGSVAESQLKLNLVYFTIKPGFWWHFFTKMMTTIRDPLPGLPEVGERCSPLEKVGLGERRSPLSPQFKHCLYQRPADSPGSGKPKPGSERWTKVAILKSTRCWTGSECSCCSIIVMWSVIIHTYIHTHIHTFLFTRTTRQLNKTKNTRWTVRSTEHWQPPIKSPIKNQAAEYQTSDWQQHSEHIASNHPFGYAWVVSSRGDTPQCRSDIGQVYERSLTVTSSSRV